MADKFAEETANTKSKFVIKDESKTHIINDEKEADLLQKFFKTFGREKISPNPAAH